MRYISVLLLTFFLISKTRSQIINASSSTKIEISGILIDEVKLKEVSKSKAWLRLLHYEKFNGKYESRLDGIDYFFAEDGKTNPYSELVASIYGFSGSKRLGRLKLKPQCALPERFRFIRESFQIEYSRYDCPQFQKFVDRFRNPHGVSLVFSSAYPNNPASMFGHTFLKFKSDRKSDLLDIGVSFAAYTPQDYNMLVFMYKGVFGGYPGLWSMQPYFEKVNEYINSESRDLWEYELNLSKEETLRLLTHLWELEISSYFDYYFFDENCAYQVLKAIEVVKLDWDITNFRYYVIPGDTIKGVLRQPDAVNRVHFRPSLYHQAEAKLKNLDKEGRNSAIKWINKETNKDQRGDVLDAALTGILYKKSQKKARWSQEDDLWENKILNLVASKKKEQGQVSYPDYYYLSKPELGHDPYSVYLSGGAYSLKDENRKIDGGFGRFKLRSAYHDLLSSDVGYTPFSEIEFPWVEFQMRGSELWLHELGLVQTTSLFPINQLDKKTSWRFKVALLRERISPCLDCLLPTIEGGLGFTLGENVRYRLYSLLLLNLDFHSRLDQGYRIRPNLELGFIVNVNNFYKARLNYNHLIDLYTNTQNYIIGISQSFIYNRNNEIRLSASKWSQVDYKKNEYGELNIQLVKYFR